MKAKVPKRNGSPGHWNHRVVKHWCEAAEEFYYTIEECHYNKGQKTPFGFTEGLTVNGESIEGLRWTLKHMLKALENPVVVASKYGEK